MGEVKILTSTWKSWTGEKETLNINFREGAVVDRLGKLLMICGPTPTPTKLTNHHQFLGIGRTHTPVFKQYEIYLPAALRLATW